ncbi:IPExxxVDY family protein [Ichthyenterobacterium sp. W332]|uniref:IPExxxVDY family protein n=1 Tax=Microcosmobacter mediterraneus TaxID=3075607 RepID=A0ABU2YIF6_9FLAO|nr:IPExxxVDY family protein [Ichthyenterobacterium sp. W332]MDT0557960.1 IPExxxVDY family protein [Ichthyenterobacterium sp. W332]
MALHKLVVDDFYDASFSLIAVHCRIKDYRLAYLINQKLNLKLSRQKYDLDFNYFAAYYAVFEWENEDQFITWNLIANQCKTEEESLQSSGSLFQNNKVQKTYQLLPELKSVDYLLKITSETGRINEKVITEKLQRIPQIITTYSVNVSKIKTKEHLIF